MRKRHVLLVLLSVIAVLFGVLVLTVWGRAAPAARAPSAASTSTLHYQGVLGDESGLRLRGVYSMTFTATTELSGGSSNS